MDDLNKCSLLWFMGTPLQTFFDKTLTYTGFLPSLTNSTFHSIIKNLYAILFSNYLDSRDLLC